MNEAVTHALSCVLGRAHAAVPRAFVERVVELQVAPAPPAAGRLVAGLAIDAGELVVVIGPRPHLDRRSRVTAILTTARVHGLRWALEVTSVGAFQRVQRRPEAHDGPAAVRHETWLESAMTADGKEIRLVDLGRLVGEVLGQPDATRAT